jgi:lysophospholipase L1-like esterase
MRTIQLIIFTLITLTGCTKKTGLTSSSTMPYIKDSTTLKIVNTDTIRYLALGDSYTIGQSVPQAESFPYQLTDTLNKLGFKAPNPLIIATTGWTTEDLLSGIAQHGTISTNYDFVTLLIGVNDQYQGSSQALYQKNFVLLLQQAICAFDTGLRRYTVCKRTRCYHRPGD